MKSYLAPKTKGLQKNPTWEGFKYIMLSENPARLKSYPFSDSILENVIF